MRRLLILLALLWTSLTLSPAQAADPENTLYLDLPWGRVVIEMRPDLAPKHVARIKELVRQRHYDGAPFHRVIEGFMAQAGGPEGTGKTLPLEASEEKHVRGIVSMARGMGLNSADNQFFIMYGSRPYLDRLYTIWGRVISGMEHVDRIRKGPDGEDGAVAEPDRIVRLRIAADIDNKPAP